VALVRHGSVRLLMQGKLAWLNGDSHTLTEQQRPLVQLLASKRRYQESELDAVMTPTARELLHEWIEQGYFAPL
jgi:50S ribosomal protein L16 3-hydroxylase